MGVKIKSRSYLKLAEDCSSDSSVENSLLIYKLAMTEAALASIPKDSSGLIARAS